MTERRFPPPWTVVRLAGGFKVVDAQGQSLAYVYSRKGAAVPTQTGTGEALHPHGSGASFLVVEVDNLNKEAPIKVVATGASQPKG